MSLGTEWSLFRHYWVVAKLTITFLCTILLLVRMQPVGHLARVVAETTLAGGELAGLRIQLVADAGATLLALLVTTALSVYKPRGMTPYGRRKVCRPIPPRRANHRQAAATGTPRWATMFEIVPIILALIFIILHLAGGGLGGH